MRTRALVLALVVTLGCEPSDSEPAPAEFAELCGELGPVRLLQFEPWRTVDLARYHGVVGGRRMFILRYADSNYGGTSWWSTGLCGEDPRHLLTTGPGTFWSVPKFDDLLFACENQMGEVQVVDPTGARPPKSVFSVGFGCSAAASDDGFAYILPDASKTSGNLMVVRWPDDPFGDAVGPELVLEGVTPGGLTPTRDPSDALQSDGSDLFVMTVEGELVRYSIPDGSVEVIATDILDFSLSREPDPDDVAGWRRRWILWQRREILNDDPAAPIGELVLLDRETAEQTSLGPGFLRGEASVFWQPGFMLLQMLVDGELRLRLYRLPSLEAIELPATLRYDGLLADGRNVLSSLPDDRGPALFDLETGETTPIPGAPVVRLWANTGALSLLPNTSYKSGDSELWVLGASGHAEQMAERATYYHSFMADGRVLSGVGLVNGPYGDLIVIEPTTLEERLIERGVLVHSAGEHPEHGTLSYVITQGERAGVWFARLAPRD